jgi:molybdopterin molybdotransferase
VSCGGPEWKGGGDPTLFSFPEALTRLLDEVRATAVELCRLEEVAGRVLRAPVIADRAFPPFDRVMMDGFALRSSDWKAGRRRFQCVGSAPAGDVARRLPESEAVCLEIMTGAPMAVGADCLVPIEEIAELSGSEVVFRADAEVEAGQFIHSAGSDVSAGRVLLEPGRLLGSREIGVAASCGFAFVEVAVLPKIAVVATGDELVEVAAVPLPHQIRQSNGHALAAALERAGIPPALTVKCGDDSKQVGPELEELLAAYDWVIFTGAISKGARDFLPEMLEHLGYRRVFHGVAQRPGKPAGCWVRADGKLVIGLPGNPVSALTGLHTFVLPALRRAVGLVVRRKHVALDDPAIGLPDYTWHLPVRILDGDRVEPAPTGNSGDFVGLLASDGFVTLPPRGERDPSKPLPFTRWL